MPSQFEKLEAHASHLLDGFLRLRERYAFLDPMLFSEEVANRRGSGRQARGFITLRHSLFLSCAQDIAKLALDKDPRTPSIRNLIESVQVQSTADELRDRFAVWVLPSIEVETDPEIIAALERIELGEQKARRLQFDNILRTLSVDGMSSPLLPTSMAFSPYATKSQRIRKFDMSLTSISLST